VVLIEALGAETLIYAKTAAGAQIVSRQAQRTAFKVGEQVGEQVGLQLDLSHAHWFDANGRTVTNPA
jgi:multiple sugar transport system ATP-binding protein